MIKKTGLYFLILLLLFSFACSTVTNIPVGPQDKEPTATISQVETQIPISPTQSGQRTEIQPTPSSINIDQHGIFLDLWNVVNEEYLYEDFNGVDWDQTYLDMEEKISEGLTNEEFYEEMYLMIYSLGDEHSAYLTPMDVAAEEAEYEGNSDYVGIGVWIAAVPEREAAVILLVFEGSPAEAAGLRSHDSILAVEGGPVLEEDGGITDGMLGLPDTSVTITVQTPGEEPRDLELIRQKIYSSYPVNAEIITSPAGLRIAYIFIPTFSESTIDDQMELSLQEMGEVDGIILDNRMNGGGFSNVMINTLSNFTKGSAGHFINREENELLRLTPRNINHSQTLPLVVLVGEGTASFGEIFSGILQDQERAYLIGETTDGNVETLWGYDFSDGSRAWIAHDVFKPYNHPEVDWEANGIIPDLHVSSEWDLVTLETDPVILAALDYFEGME